LGYELLLLNGMITFVGLMLIQRKPWKYNLPPLYKVAPASANAPLQTYPNLPS
jgi:hypothetical protein